ncbi:MAG: acyl carrier protein [Clostridia bacterium]|nr:acyl carrier protein [Clostridia bacterium]
MEEEVKKIIHDAFFIDMDKITNDSSLKDDLEIDSLDATSLVLDIENKYNIRVSDEELINLVYVRDIIKLLEEKGVKIEG